MAYYSYEFTDSEILKLFNRFGIKIMTRNEFIKMFGECPFEMIRKGHCFTDPEILSIKVSHPEVLGFGQDYDCFIITNVQTYQVTVENQLIEEATDYQVITWGEFVLFFPEKT